MTSLRLVLVSSLCASLAACVITPNDGANGGKRARGGVSPTFDMVGYANGPNQQVTIEARDQRFSDSWIKIGTAVSAKTQTFEGLYGWNAKDLQLFFSYFFKELGAGSSSEVRARFDYEGSKYSMVTFTKAGIDCLMGELYAGKTPGNAGADCATGNTVKLQWGYDGINFDNGSFNCSSVNKIHAYPEEDGHRMAVRLTPSKWPFQVKQLRYHLVGGEDNCRTDLPHRIEIYKGTTNKPPATPTILQHYDRTPTAIDHERAELVDLTTPIWLYEGQSLFVSIEMQRVGDGAICVPACAVPSSAYVPGRNWWSNAVAPPYAWAELSTFGLYDLPRVGMSGIAY